MLFCRVNKCRKLIIGQRLHIDDSKEGINQCGKLRVEDGLVVVVVDDDDGLVEDDDEVGIVMTREGAKEYKVNTHPTMGEGEGLCLTLQTQ